MPEWPGWEVPAFSSFGSTSARLLHVADGVQRALSPPPRDFREFAQDAAAAEGCQAGADRRMIEGGHLPWILRRQPVAVPAGGTGATLGEAAGARFRPCLPRRRSPGWSQGRTRGSHAAPGRTGRRPWPPAIGQGRGLCSPSGRRGWRRRSDRRLGPASHRRPGRRGTSNQPPSISPSLGVVMRASSRGGRTELSSAANPRPPQRRPRGSRLGPGRQLLSGAHADASAVDIQILSPGPVGQYLAAFDGLQRHQSASGLRPSTAGRAVPSRGSPSRYSPRWASMDAAK